MGLGVYFNTLTFGQYDQEIEKRLYAEDLEVGGWYLTRFTDELARQAGKYAIETVIILRSLQSDDDDYELQATVLDADGRPVCPGDSMLNSDGMLFDRKHPNEEGYLLAYPDILDGPLGDIHEQIPQFSAH